MTPPEDARKNIARCSGYRSPVRNVLVFARDRENDAGSLRRYDVRTDLIQIKNDASDVRSGTVLGGSDLAHAIGANRDVPGAGVTDRVRKIQQ